VRERVCTDDRLLACTLKQLPCWRAYSSSLSPACLYLCWDCKNLSGADCHHDLFHSRVPARSPSPFIVHQLSRAVLRAASEFAVASRDRCGNAPKWQLYQCFDVLLIARISSPNSCGIMYPTVSGILTVIAPRWWPPQSLWTGIAVCASSVHRENSRHARTPSPPHHLDARSNACSRVMRNWCLRCMSEVEMKCVSSAFQLPSRRSTQSRYLRLQRARER